MGLNQIKSETVATTVAAQPDKTILQQFYGSGATLMYTVPEGRKFKGYFWGESSNVPGYLITGGATINNSQNGTYTGQSQWPPFSQQYINGTPELTLNAGDAIYSGANNNYRARVVGVESDA